MFIFVVERGGINLTKDDTYCNKVLIESFVFWAFGGNYLSLLVGILHLPVYGRQFKKDCVLG